jgi:hypothetical protein
MSDLIEKLHAVKDEQTFAEFLHALAEDRRAPNPVSPWQWDTLEDFLDAAGSWADSSKNGLPLYEVPGNAWKRAADIIFAGKIYE